MTKRTYIAYDVHHDNGLMTCVDLATVAMGRVTVATFIGAQGLPLFGAFLDHAARQHGWIVQTEDGTVLAGEIGDMVN